MDDYLFYAETNSGYHIKCLVEVLQSCLTNEAFFKISKSGIRSSDTDNKETILLHIDLPMENFQNYKCEKDMTVAVTIKHLHKLLKNVKKKDSVALFINKSSTNKLGIKIVPIMINKKSERAEISFITFREVKKDMISPPKGYHFPKVINSTEYQKMCKKMAVVPGKLITITIQQNNYIKFFCDGGDVISSEMTFGELDNNDNIFEANFYTTMLHQLIKMPGLSNQMQISAPTKKLFPIRIKMKAGDLGIIEVYLKPKELIEHEIEASKK